MSRFVCYIAGPFRGVTSWEVAEHVRAAERAAFEVARLGAVPLVPHSMFAHFDGTISDDYWLEATLELLHRCDGLLMLERWILSEGARGEHGAFKGPKFYSVAALEAFLEGRE